MVCASFSLELNPSSKQPSVSNLVCRRVLHCFLDMLHIQLNTPQLIGASAAEVMRRDIFVLGSEYIPQNESGAAA